jgi:hypothetical protein
MPEALPWAADTAKARDRVNKGEAPSEVFALERMVFNKPNIDEIIGNVRYDRLRQSLSHVEGRIAALPPGHANEPRLRRMRDAFRVLLRAKQDQS